MTIQELPRWDLSNVYPSLDSEELAQANKDLIQQILLGQVLEIPFLIFLN